MPLRMPLLKSPFKLQIKSFSLLWLFHFLKEMVISLSLFFLFFFFFSPLLPLLMESLLCLRSGHLIYLSFSWPHPKELSINSTRVEISCSPFSFFALSCEHNMPFSFYHIIVFCMCGIAYYLLK